MADFKGIQEQYDDINQVGSRPVGLMTEFTTEAGRPIYISHNGEIVSEKSTTIPYNGKYVNVPSIHDGIEYSEFELIKLLDEKKIKPTSTHKTQELAVKASQKRSPSLMSEKTARAVESKYWKEMTKRKATTDQILGDSSTELVTPDAKAERRMDDLQAIQDDQFLNLYDENEKSQKLDAYMSTLSEDDKRGLQSYLDKPTPKINSIEGEEAMAKGRARRNDVDETVTAFNEGGYEDGGLKDEGGSVDPVSGNDVPVGSTQEEVRDDIQAQLSEGEFVLPADVVRYIGLENLMELRSKAKEGLAKMEAMGQMGNSEEAVMDSDGEYDSEIDDLIDNFDPNDPETLSFAEGGVVHAYDGANITSSTQQNYAYVPPSNITSPNVNVQPYPLAVQSPQYSAGYFPQSVYTPPALQPTGQQKIYSPGVGVGGGVSELRQYQGPNGEMISILFLNGIPQQEIPKGYTRFKPEEVKAPEVAAPTVQQPTSDGDGGDSMGTAQQQQQQKEQYEGWVTTMNQLSELDPEFAKTWNESPKNPKNQSEGLLGGLKDFVKNGGVVGLVRDALELNSASTDAYKKIANQYGLDIGKYENSFSFFGLDKYNESSLVNDAMATKTVAESIAKSSGGKLTPEQTIANIARSDIKLDANNDGKITDEEKKAVETSLFMDDELSDRELREMLAEKPDARTEAFAALFEEENDERLTLDDTRSRARDPLEGSKVSRTEYDTAVRNISAGTPGVSPSDVSVTSISPKGEVNVDINGDGIADRAVDSKGNSRNFNIDRSNDDYDASGRQTTTGANKDVKEVGFDEGDTGDTGASNGTYCCTKMVEHGLWDKKNQLAKMHNWHMKQPHWWRDGYDIWGKVLADTLLKNNSPFWTSVMQECYEYHINKKKLSLKSALGNGIMFSGVAVCGLIASLCGRHVNELQCRTNPRDQK